jgi:excisionase family DNA binding protein
MLPPGRAWRIFRVRTGGGVSRATFYRWVASGKVFSIRVGHKFSIPWTALDEVIRQCLAGERF